MSLAAVLPVCEDGLAGLFKGYWFNLILCSNPAIQNTIFDKQLGVWRTQRQHPPDVHFAPVSNCIQLPRIQEAMLLRKKQRAASAKVSLTSLEVKLDRIRSSSDKRAGCSALALEAAGKLLLCKPTWLRFMLGALAKAIATMITFPVTRIKTMLQARGKRKPCSELMLSTCSTVFCRDQRASMHVTCSKMRFHSFTFNVGALSWNA